MRTDDIASWPCCPTCHLPNHASRVVCSTCGSLIPIERITAHGRARARRALTTLSDRILLDRATWVLWLLALAPLTFLPPVLALSTILTRWHAICAKPRGFQHAVRVALVAGANIVASAILISFFSDGLASLIAAAWQTLRDLPQGLPRTGAYRYA